MKREGYRPKNTQEGQKDLEEAQRLMREMGYGLNNPLRFDAEGDQSYPVVDLTATEIAKSQLKRIWIDITRINIRDYAQVVQEDTSGNFLFRSRGYNAPMEPDAQLYTRHHTKGARNFQRLSDPELDSLIEEQRREPDTAKRKQLVMKAQERLWSLYPQMWLHTRETIFAMQPWVETQPTAWRRWGDPASTWINR